MTVVVIGNGTTTIFVGHSPAIDVTQGDVIISDVTFTTATDSPTILVSGGSLTLRDDLIEESTGFTDAAISLTGGTLDLGTAGDPGGNTLNVNGLGEFVHNTTGNSVPAAGDTFQVNGTAVAEPYLSFTAVSTSTASSVYGQAVTLTATVVANTPSTGKLGGSVDFFDATTDTDLGSEPVANGIAALTHHEARCRPARDLRLLQRRRQFHVEPRFADSNDHARAPDRHRGPLDNRHRPRRHRAHADHHL